MSIDKIEWHLDEVTNDENEEDLFEKAGAHIGYYLEWAYKKGFAPNNPETNDISDEQKLINSEITGIQYLIENCDTKFWEEDLNKEGQRFTSFAYDTYVENLEKILGHKPYNTKYNQQDFESVSNYLNQIYNDYLTNLSSKQIKEENKIYTSKTDSKELIIKNKIGIGNVTILIILLVVSIAAFSAFFESSENIGLLILGILLGVFFVGLLPYMTFKRPYMKLNSKGIIYIESKGHNLYGREVIIPWNKIDSIIYFGKVFSIEDMNIKESELNVDYFSIFETVNKSTLNDDDDDTEWLRNGVFVVTKKNNFQQIHDISGFIHKSYVKVKLSI